MNKVRFGEDAETSTRDACAPQSAKSAQSAVGNLLDDLEGPSGGRIVAEVFIGLLLGDQFSFLSQDPSWKPLKEFATTGRKFGMAELIKQAMRA
jgi:hypothetical protein